MGHVDNILSAVLGMWTKRDKEGGQGRDTWPPYGVEKTMQIPGKVTMNGPSGVWMPPFS